MTAMLFFLCNHVTRIGKENGKSTSEIMETEKADFLPRLQASGYKETGGFA